MEPSEPPLDPLLKTKAVLQKRGSMEPMEPLASFPVPRPAFCRFQYGTASDEKLGVGLGTRLWNHL